MQKSLDWQRMNNKETMEQKNKILPELRFPEFVKDGEWKENLLGEISEIVRGGSPRPIQDYLTTSSEGLNWLKIADVHSDSKYITATKEKVINEALSSTREVDCGDLILSNSMSFGRPYILKIKTCIHDGWIAIRKISNVTFEDYLYYFISSEACQHYFNINAAGAAVKNLNAEIIKLLPISLPKNIKEQQKIADCLSSLDELITAHNDKLETLKNHKKGLLQNLFPQENQKVPNYRFPEFVNDEEWEERKLGEVASFINGRAYKQEELLDNGKYRVLRVGNFFTNNSWYYSNLELDNDKYCDNGDLLYAWSASFGPRIWNGEKVIYHYHIWKVIESLNINKTFLFVLLDNETERMKSQNANGFALLHITKGTIENWKCYIPKSKKEQQKIAECLTEIDNLITAQTEKIEQLKAHKKGLMQGLFPQVKN